LFCLWMKVKYVTIQLEATEIYFQELRYIMSVVIIMVLTLKPLEKPTCMTIQMKVIEQYFHVALLIMLYKVVLTLKSVDKTLVCYHLNESY